MTMDYVLTLKILCDLDFSLENQEVIYGYRLLKAYPHFKDSQVIESLVYVLFLLRQLVFNFIIMQVLLPPSQLN